ANTGTYIDAPFHRFGDVLRVVEAVKGGVDIRPRVGENVDLAHLERRTRAIAGARSVAGKPVADRGRREAGVGDHPVLDRVAQIDEPGSRGRHGALADGGDARSGAARRAGSCPENCWGWRDRSSRDG